MTIVVIQSFSHSTTTTNYHMLYMSRPPVGSGGTLMIKNPQNVSVPLGYYLVVSEFWAQDVMKFLGYVCQKVKMKLLLSLTLRN